MKKLMCLPILLFILNTSNVFAQVSQDSESTSDRKNVINVNLSSFVIGHFGISYERVLTQKMSVRLYGDFAGYNLKVDDNKINLNGFGIIPEFRYYVSKKGAPKGYFIGLYAPIRRYKFDGAITDDGKLYVGDGSASYIGFGFVNGPQFLLGNRISLAIPFGISVGGGSSKSNFKYQKDDGTFETKNYDIPLTGSAFMPRISFELGIAF